MDTNARNAYRRRQVSRGFTLLELITAVAIVAILVAVALPNFSEFLIRSTVSDNSSDLIAAINVARSEAVKRGRPVSVIANGGNWNAGWQVVVAKEIVGGVQSTPVTPGPAEADCKAYVDNAVNAGSTTPLCPRWRGSLPTDYTIAGIHTGVGGVDTQFTFNPTGTLSPANTSFDFSVCRPVGHSDVRRSRWVTVTAMGVITSRRDVTSSPAGVCP
ncbi:MAG: GspH/FimT family pseudopilin [Dokdonella sp.]